MLTVPRCKARLSDPFWGGAKVELKEGVAYLSCPYCDTGSAGYIVLAKLDFLKQAKREYANFHDRFHGNQ